MVQYHYISSIRSRQKMQRLLAPAFFVLGMNWIGSFYGKVVNDCSLDVAVLFAASFDSATK